MVPGTFLFIFHAGSHRLGSNNFRNSSYKEETAGSSWKPGNYTWIICVPVNDLKSDSQPLKKVVICFI